LFYYLIINVLVSACTMVVVLSIWERTHPLTTDGVLPFSLAKPTLIPTFTPGGGIGQTTADTTEGPTTGDTTTPNPFPESAQTMQEYKVESGDTLGAIAARFGVSVQAIIEANDLSDPDRLESGQVLMIPVPAGTPEGTPTQTPFLSEETGTPPASTTPLPPSGEAKVVIEIVVGAGDLGSERVRLSRLGPGEISLAGWKLVEEGGKVFTFPQLTLFEGGAVDLYTKRGQLTPVILYWGLDEPVWESGEKVTLLDSQGKAHATYLVP